MSEIIIIPIENIIDKNVDFTGIKCDEKRAKAVEGCYSSFYYYDTSQEQITSIVVSLIKGHFFIDGNKRTALYAYIFLSQLNKIKYIEDEQKQVDLFVEIATTRKSIEEYTKMLFPR